MGEKAPTLEGPRAWGTHLNPPKCPALGAFCRMTEVAPQKKREHRCSLRHISTWHSAVAVADKRSRFCLHSNRSPETLAGGWCQCEGWPLTTSTVHPWPSDVLQALVGGLALSEPRETLAGALGPKHGYLRPCPSVHWRVQTLG